MRWATLLGLSPTATTGEPLRALGLALLEGVTSLLAAVIWACSFAAVVVVVAALVDFEGLRSWLLSVSGETLRSWALIVVAGGLGLQGMLPSVGRRSITDGRSPAAVPAMAQGLAFVSRARARDLALRETSLSRAIPTAEQMWQLRDLAAEVMRDENAGGSELLDRKVLRALGVEAALQPTRNMEHAIDLLSYRFGGMRSALMWKVECSEILGDSGWVDVFVRESARGEKQPDWLLFDRVGTKNARIAVVVAVLDRETMLYTTGR